MLGGRRLLTHGGAGGEEISPRLHENLYVTTRLDGSLCSSLNRFRYPARSKEGLSPAEVFSHIGKYTHTNKHFHTFWHRYADVLVSTVCT
jgi:hypothetical protein